MINSKQKSLTDWRSKSILLAISEGLVVRFLLFTKKIYYFFSTKETLLMSILHQKCNKII